MAEPIAYESLFRLDAGTHTKAIGHMAFTSDGKSLVTADETILRVWDPPRGSRY